MKICMLGAGAMGSSIGGWLAAGGEDVQLGGSDRQLSYHLQSVAS